MQKQRLIGKMADEWQHASQRLRLRPVATALPLGFFVPVRFYDDTREDVAEQDVLLSDAQITQLGGLKEATLFVNEAEEELGVFVPETIADTSLTQCTIDQFATLSVS
jgi:hypothetical protein